MEENKQKKGKSETYGMHKKKYEKPRIISYEPIEAVAGVCKQLANQFVCPGPWPPVTNS